MRKTKEGKRIDSMAETAFMDKDRRNLPYHPFSFRKPDMSLLHKMHHPDCTIFLNVSWQPSGLSRYGIFRFIDERVLVDVQMMAGPTLSKFGYLPALDRKTFELEKEVAFIVYDDVSYSLVANLCGGYHGSLLATLTKICEENTPIHSPSTLK